MTEPDRRADFTLSVTITEPIRRLINPNLITGLAHITTRDHYAQVVKYRTVDLVTLAIWDHRHTPQ